MMGSVKCRPKFGVREEKKLRRKERKRRKGADRN